MTDPAETPASRRERAAKAVDDARARARQARDRALEQGRNARARASSGLESNPLVAVAGGLAIGALAAAILPHSRREDELLGNTGKRIRDTAKQAAKAARDAGKAELDGLGVNAEMAKGEFKTLLNKVGVAAKAAGAAATTSTKKSKKAK